MTIEQARDIAIEWQRGFEDHNYSWGELAWWSDYFEALAEKFPELRDEFEENGIL